MKEDNHYPFKEEDEIEIIKPEKEKNYEGCFVEFKSSLKKD